MPFISGDTGCVAQTDLCLIQGSSTILLIIQEDKTGFSQKDPEAQVIAEAIAVFQYNNLSRDQAGFDTVESMTILLGCTSHTSKGPVSLLDSPRS